MVVVFSYRSSEVKATYRTEIRDSLNHPLPCFSRASTLALEFRVNVTSESGWPLFVKGRFNSAARTLNYALILTTEGRIYGLDLGKDHHNPQCDQVGEKHKHTWSERYSDKEAHVLDDIYAHLSDPVSVWTEFCVEAGIQHDGKMNVPPAIQGELW